MKGFVKLQREELEQISGGRIKPQPLYGVQVGVEKNVAMYGVRQPAVTPKYGIRCKLDDNE
jgi:hypothetical protein